MHESLPWYVNGTLDVEECTAFEQHLAGCPGCREELRLIQDLQSELRESGAATLGEHPSPESLLAAAAPETGDLELDTETGKETRRHLALCAICSEELSWLQGEAVAAAPGGEVRSPEAERFVPRAMWVRWAGLAAAAILVLLVALPLVSRFREGPGRPGMAPPPHGVPSAERALADPAPILVDRDQDVVRLLFEVDLGPGQFPAAFEVLTADGHSVFYAETLQPGDLLRGAFLFFDCPHRDCPDGEYLARLTAGGDEPHTVEYPFQLTTARAAD